MGNGARVTLIKPAMEKQKQNWYKRPVAGISSIAAVLEADGNEVQLIDAYYSGLKLRDILSEIDYFSPDVIGITAMTNEVHRAAEIIRAAKEKHKVPSILGGPHATALPSRTMTEFKEFDYLICGEGEHSTAGLIKYISGEISDINTINNLVYRMDGGGIGYSEKKERFEQNLDLLPFPAYHHYYKTTGYLKDKDEWYPLFSSRGCPFKCSFCMQVLGREVRYRSPANVISEIEMAIDRYGATKFDFTDEIFLFDNERTHEILDYLISMKPKIKWCALTRVNYVSDELVKKAKAAGCVKLGMGIESGNDNILKKTSKQISTEKAKRAVEIIKKTGVTLETYFILGHPDETVDTIKDTINFAAELNTATIAIGMMVPYPGTKIWDLAQEGKGGYRLLSEDWRDYDKYGGRALELSAISYKNLKMWQLKGYILFYIKNKRFIDLMKFLVPRWKGVLDFLRRF